VWRFLLRLEDFLEGSLSSLDRNAMSVTSWLAALFLPCAVSVGVIALLTQSNTLHEWYECATLGMAAAAGPTLIVLICLFFVPGRLALWTVAGGCIVSPALAVWWLHAALSAG
jgi:hypothetical protein